MHKNYVRNYRESRLMSKAELARRSGLSALTIDRVEAGRPCRLDTKRKILEALGLTVRDNVRVFEGPSVSVPPSVERSDDFNFAYGREGSADPLAREIR